MTIKIAVLAMVFLFVAVHPLAAQTGVVINEVMYAPHSPEPEWIELFNTDSTAINLTNWQIVTTSKTGTIPACSIPGEGYLVLTKDSLGLITLRPGNYSIVQMPLEDLPNTGSELILRNASGQQTMDSFAYLPSWGGSSGASLEQRNALHPATDPTNWGTSQAASGATPGARNSIAVTSDTTPAAKPAHPLDVVMNELMVAIVKPEPQWIELLNATADTINIAGWTLSVLGHSAVAIPDSNSVLPPDSMLILSSDDTTLAQYRKIPAERIVQISLTHMNYGGSTLALRDGLGNPIDSVSYNGSLIKTDGISLERIDPSKPGYDPANWAACEDSSGSTILRPNSVRKREHDVVLVSMDGVDEVDTSAIFTVANLGRDTSHFVDIHVQVENLDTITTTIPIFLPPDSTIQFTMPLPQNFYGLFHGFAFLIDSLNVQPSNDSIPFTITLPVPQDSLVINEIMFDPQTTSCEWLELANRSSCWISLDSTRLVTGEKRPGEYSHTITPLLIAPDSFGVIAADSSLFYQTYLSLTHGTNVAGLSVSSLDFGRDSCFLTLHNLDSTTIDSVHYFKTWQQSLLRKTFVGISLERIDPASLSNDARNWQACIDTSGATPLARNSIASTSPGDTASSLPAGTVFKASFSPNPFSPDGDGFEDFTTLTIQTGDATSTWAMRIRLYDARGVMVRMLTDATTIIGATTLSFDGKRDNGQTLPPGLYTVLIELTSSSPLRTLKQAIGVVIAGRRR